MGGKPTKETLRIEERRVHNTRYLRMDASYVDRMKKRLGNMRRIAAMAHDPRIIELVTETADELEEDIRKVEAEGSAPVIIHLEPPPGS